MCSDGSICCGLRNDICCTSKNGFWLINGTVLSYGARPSGTSLTVPSTTASFIPFLNRESSTPNISAATNQKSSSIPTLPLGLGVGLGVGIPIFLAIIAAALIYFRRRSNGQQTGGRINELLASEKKLGELDSIASPRELESNLGLRELDLNPAPGELDSTPVPRKLG
jgi:hypothetical protein